MKDTSDTMEDIMSEDTMMDCGEGLNEFIDLATDISDSVPNIRDAAERLLSLLNVDDADDETSYSEDEGVELDLDEVDESNENSQFLHQLAKTLVQELKYVQKSSAKHTSMPYNSEEQMHMDVAQENSFQMSSLLSQKYVMTNHRQISHNESNYHNNYVTHQTTLNDGFTSNKRCRIDQEFRDNKNENRTEDIHQTSNILNSWNAGWDACATEAVRYLLKVEGLAPHHPRVLSLKSHLGMQKDKILAQYAKT